jgi:hypothetical protein
MIVEEGSTMSTILEGHALLDYTSQWLARTPGIATAHAKGQSREILDRRPREGRWSQSEILAHLADFEVVCFQARMEAILRGNPISSLNADERAAEIPYAAINPRTSLDVFMGERDRSLARIRKLSPDQLTRGANHRELGEITLGTLLIEWVNHDLSHLRQLVTTGAQVFRPGTSRWRPVPQVSGVSVQASMCA